MIDKQIIFKCDVDCIRKNTEECFELDCIKGQESILKQLKAKEQECDELEKQNEILLGQLVINDGEDVTVQISQSQFEEYNQLKAENDTYKKMLEDEDVQLALNEVRTGERHLWYNKAQRLEQALTEIKEIAEKIGDECEYSFFASCAKKAKKQILQKISEVIDDI